jgi:O-antigen ligase
MVLSKVRSRRLETVLGLIVIAILVVLLAPLAPGWARFDRVVDFVETLQETGDVDEQLLAIATSGRTAIWQDSVSAWRGSPLVGVGLGNYPGGVFSHNFAIEILTELGLLGIALFILFFSAVVLSLRRLMAQSDDPMMARLIVGLLVFALMHMSFSGRLQTITDFWLAAGLACGFGLNPWRQTGRSGGSGNDQSQ